ncbi:MAG: 4-(cytidine 5'-diphospho)-2-C-methyl-D-erythritol kinase [Alistipes sp.]|nr:4-(cytidine 5'-diphospho)-2-C-methyl-D-erythritol kinase [Alistipes sp.]
MIPFHKSVTVKAAAKINLVLDVTGRLPNGYHTIESVFQTVGIYDRVTVEISDTLHGIGISCDVPAEFADVDEIPCDERNIAFKAAAAFLEETGLDMGCKIHIVKKIPSQAGMGGGSADAAAVLFCLRKMTGRSLAHPERLGADVPFFLTGGTAYVEGIGEKITKIADYDKQILVIAKGGEGVSTGAAYGAVDALENPVHPDAKAIAEEISSAPETAYKLVGNIFEEAIKLNSVAEIKAEMLRHDAGSAAMTGSGSAVFGIFHSESQAKACAETLELSGFYAKVCSTVAESFRDVQLTNLI